MDRIEKLMFNIRRVDRIKFQCDKNISIRWPQELLLKKARMIDMLGIASGAYAQIYGDSIFGTFIWDNEVDRLVIPWRKVSVMELARPV